MAARAEQIQQRVRHLLFPEVFANTSKAKEHKHQAIFPIRKAGAISEQATQQRTLASGRKVKVEWCERRQGAQSARKAVAEG